MEATYRPIRGPAAYSPEWFKMRPLIVGASEAAAACGCSSWSQPRDLYEKKRSMVEAQQRADGEQTPEQRRGHRYEEPVLLDFLDQRPGALWRQPPAFLHPDNNFVLSTPDALWKATDGESGRINYKTAWPGCRPIDAKTWAGGTADFGEEGSDDVPMDMLFQAQQHCYVAGSDGCDLPVLFGFKLKIYSVPRNDDLIEMIVESERELIERIENRDPPPIDYAHRNAEALVKSIHREVGDQVIDLTREQTFLVLAREEIGQRIRDLEKTRATLAAEIRDTLGSANIANLHGDERFLERKQVHRAAHEVPESSFIELRLKKARKKKEK